MKKKRPEREKQSIQEYDYDLRSKADRAVKAVHDRLKGKTMKPHPHLKRTWIYE